jgi:hypothetical protein
MRKPTRYDFHAARSQRQAESQKRLDDARAKKARYQMWDEHRANIEKARKALPSAENVWTTKEELERLLSAVLRRGAPEATSEEIQTRFERAGRKTRVLDMQQFLDLMEGAPPEDNNSK